MNTPNQYPELNPHGLTAYHKQKLCYPYTEQPAFTFWSMPDPEDPLPDYICPLRAWQDGRCALCGFRDRLVEDHCHDSGLVRGYLCKSCNTTEGRSDYHLSLWRGGTTPAAALGIKRLYVSPITGETPIRTAAVDSDLDLIAEAVTK